MTDYSIKAFANELEKIAVIKTASRQRKSFELAGPFQGQT